MKEIKTNTSKEETSLQTWTHDTFGNLVTYTSDGTVWYLESDIQRILVSGRQSRQSKGLIDYVKVDLSNYADFTKHNGMRKERTFILREDVMYVFKISTLDPFQKQEFAKWILSIDPLSEQEQQELNRFQVVTHDTFGSLLTYTDANGIKWYYCKDLQRLFKTDNRGIFLMMSRQSKTTHYINHMKINPSLLLLHPNLHVVTRSWQLGNLELFCTKEAFLRFSRNCSGNMKQSLRKELRQWIIDTTIDSTVSC